MSNPVPSDQIIDFRRNAQDADKIVNDDADVVTRTGKVIKAIGPLVQQVDDARGSAILAIDSAQSQAQSASTSAIQSIQQAEAATQGALDDAVESIITEGEQAAASTGWFVVGDFADGFEFTARNQVGVDTNGNTWSYNGSLPFTVTAGTTPSEPDYTNRGDAALRSALAAEGGASLVRGTVFTVDSLIDLLNAPQREGQQVQNAGFYPRSGGFATSESVMGGGKWIYSPSHDLTLSNGGTVVAVSILSDWIDAAQALGGLTKENLHASLSVLLSAGSGVGAAWVRIDSYDITSSDFGAAVNTPLNNTLAMQSALDHIGEAGGGKLKIPDGEWMIDSHSKDDGQPRWSYGLDVRSNTHVELSPGCVLKVIPNSSEGYSLFRVKGSENVLITGGAIEGDKFDHIYEGTQEWGMGVTISEGAKNVGISGVRIFNCMGDGIYIRSRQTPLSGVLIESCVIHNCRRHEITIVSGSSIVVDKCDFYKSSSAKDGVANVTYGGLNIDIEPSNNKEDPPKEITFSRNNFLCPTNACFRSDTKLNAVRNLKVFSNNFRGSSAFPLIEAFSVNNGDGVYFHDNTIEGQGQGLSIELRSVKNAKVYSNEADCLRGIALIRDPSYNQTNYVTELCDNIKVHGNIISAQQLNMRVQATNSEIHDETLTLNNSTQVTVNILGDSKNVRFYNSSATNLGTTVRMGTGCEDVVVSGCELTSTGRRALEIFPGSRNKIKDNSFILPEGSSGTYHVRVRNTQERLLIQGNSFLLGEDKTVSYGVLHTSGAGDVHLIANDFAGAGTTEYFLSGDVSTNLVRGGNILVNGTYEAIPT